MIIFFILGILLGGFAVVFTLQNIGSVTVNFFTYQLIGSLSTVLLLTLLVGVIITLLFVLPASISNYFKYRSLKKENNKLAEELRRQKELTVFAKEVPPTREDLAKIEKGAVADTDTL